MAYDVVLFGERVYTPALKRVWTDLVGVRVLFPKKTWSSVESLCLAGREFFVLQLDATIKNIWLHVDFSFGRFFNVFPMAIKQQLQNVHIWEQYNINYKNVRQIGTQSYEQAPNATPLSEYTGDLSVLAAEVITFMGIDKIEFNPQMNRRRLWKMLGFTVLCPVISKIERV